MHATHSTPSLAARFARNTFVVRSETPLAEDLMRQAAPSIFAERKLVVGKRVVPRPEPPSL